MKTKKKSGTLYFIWKKVGSEWQFIFRMYERSPNYVRMYLAEGGYEGEYQWKSEKGKWHYTKLVR